MTTPHLLLQCQHCHIWPAKYIIDGLLICPNCVEKEELQHEHEMQKRLGELAEIAGYLVEGMVERLCEFDLPQSDIEYIVKNLSALMQKELDSRIPKSLNDDDIPF